MWSLLNVSHSLFITAENVGNKNLKRCLSIRVFLCKSCGFQEKHKEVSITELLMLQLLFVTVYLAVKKRSSKHAEISGVSYYPYYLNELLTPSIYRSAGVQEVLFN